MAELPDFGNIHAEAAKGLTDIADDAGAIFDNKADIERPVDLFFRLNFQRACRAMRLGRPVNWPSPRASSQTSPSTATAVGPPPAPGPTRT